MHNSKEIKLTRKDKEAMADALAMFFFEYFQRGASKTEARDKANPSLPNGEHVHSETETASEELLQQNPTNLPS